jgi:amidophosphoribosyltransferase
MAAGFREDGPREACGVFGIYAPGRDVARLTFFALYALQHRGQESAGIATSDGRGAHIHKSMGLVSQVFTEENLRPLVGYLAIGHNRYSTTGSSVLRNAQPYLIETLHGPLGVGHNGNLTNALILRRKLLERGVGLSSTSDSEVITQMLAGMPGPAWEPRIAAFMAEAEGAYSLTILTRDAVFGVRDPWGLRPLVIGRFPGGDGWCIASESCALSTIGAEYVREVAPGEIVRLDANGLTATQGRAPEQRSLCIFEFIYFARPDSLLDDQVVHRVRVRLGRELAREQPADADLVIGVPDSATPAAVGYAEESGIPFGEGLIKNRYIGRTFIQPDEGLRRLGVALKFNPLPSNLKGKRVVLVDDSIVRGNTSGPLVRLLRDGGAREVHMRITSPPIRHPCFMGVDMATYNELIAHRLTVEEIRQHLGCDSLGYLSLDGLERAVSEEVGNGTGPIGRGYCTACFSGSYPIRLEEWWLSEDRIKLAFEGTLPG